MRILTCDRCETGQITLETQRDENGREYILPACLEKIEKNQAKIDEQESKIAQMYHDDSGRWLKHY